MIERDDSVFVRHMRDAIGRIQTYLDGVSRDEYEDRPMLQDAVVRQLEILGEAAGRVSRSLCAEHPEIPWAKITGMRHRMIHDYFEVDAALVWKTATDHVAELRPQVLALLVELGIDE